MTNIITPAGYLSFCNFFKAKPKNAQDPSSTLVYQTNLIIPKSQIEKPEYKAMLATISDVAENEFGKEWAKKINGNTGIKPGSAKDYEGYDDDCVFLRAWTSRQPSVVNMQKEPVSEENVWAGQVARLSLKCFAYNNPTRKGVSFLLNSVQIIVADKKRLDGQQTVEAAFESAVDADSISSEMGGTATTADAAAAGISNDPTDDLFAQV